MTIWSFSFSQLNMSKITSIKLGETFKISKPKIKMLFSQKPKIKKADFLGAYKIEYESVPFDFYGDADYTFQYIKDTLVSIEVDFKFLASETYKFKRLYTTLMADISKDQSKKIMTEYSNLDYEKSVKEIEKECGKNKNTSGENYKPVNLKSLGTNYWEIYDESIFTNKFLRISVSIGEYIKMGNHQTGAGRYYGCQVHNEIKIGGYDYLDLQSQLEKIPSTYTEIPDE